LTAVAALTVPSIRRHRPRVGAGHEAGVVGGEKDDTPGDVIEPTDRVARQGELTRRIDIDGSEIARPADKGRLAHIRLDRDLYK
jgi:hypothetical protein